MLSKSQAHHIKAVYELSLGCDNGARICDVAEKLNASKASASLNRFGARAQGKTQNAIRTFVLPGYAVQVIADQRQMLKKAGIASKYLLPTPDGLQSTSQCAKGQSPRRY
jgi:hypothetical protein